MLTLLDNLFPWFGDMIELGGDILLLILIIAAFMWAFIIERLVFFWWVFPAKQKLLQEIWQQRHEKVSWYAKQYRTLLIGRAARDVNRNLSIISTMVKICPLLGLLGTVMGMLEIFDALAITGNNSARATAGGVSKATVSTMAGMVVAISGFMISNYLTTRAANTQSLLLEMLPMDKKQRVNNKD